MSKAMRNRVRALVARLGVPDGPKPTLFVGVTDDGIPDPDSDPVKDCPDLDSAATGYMGSGIQVNRRKNEPVADLQARCRDQHPQVRVWFEMHPGVNA